MAKLTGDTLLSGRAVDETTHRQPLRCLLKNVQVASCSYPGSKTPVKCAGVGPIRAPEPPRGAPKPAPRGAPVLITYQVVSQSNLLFSLPLSSASCSWIAYWVALTRFCAPAALGTGRSPAVSCYERFFPRSGDLRSAGMGRVHSHLTLNAASDKSHHVLFRRAGRRVWEITALLVPRKTSRNSPECDTRP